MIVRVAKQLRRTARANQSGNLLIEVLIAMLVATIFAAAILQMYVQTFALSNFALLSLNSTQGGFLWARMDTLNSVNYAPNSAVNVGSQPITNPANFYGAIVGGVARVISDFNNGAGAFFHYDYNLHPQGSPAFVDPMSINAVSTMVTGNTPWITGYRAVTWQEAVLPSSYPSQVRWY